MKGEKQKRKVRTYKATDDNYEWAMKFAEKGKMALSNILEEKVGQLAQIAKNSLKPRK